MVALLGGRVGTRQSTVGVRAVQRGSVVGRGSVAVTGGRSGYMVTHIHTALVPEKHRVECGYCV